MGISHCFDMDRLGHAGVKVKWEPVEARHGVDAQADALRGYAAATFSGRYSKFTAMPDSAPVTPVIVSLAIFHKLAKVSFRAQPSAGLFRFCASPAHARSPRGRFIHL